PLVSAGPPIESRPLANTPTVKVEPRGQKVPYSDKAIAQFSTPDSGPAVPGGPAEIPPAAVPVPVPVAPPAAEPAKSGTQKEDVDWMWPAKGKVIAPFAEATKGMDIAGKRGSPVVAAAAGRVIYADAGLRGYGKLVIIRHNDTWLSAYAHNDNILVKEQQEVKKGQKIAEMGSTDADQVKLHFEIRRQGKPVDPAKVLPPM
ncbi:MAG TPA: peptidoglycan DD-metalloendopeptidase family protein, partial [Usitatibacter sp.]|nr:peptidoglycan DD-metalloendopeptidase family protein [Usitatibacter sp.]